MSFLSRLFGRHARIRKQSSDLTLADWEFAKVWEGCLEEESTEGQDESTVRPRPDLVAISDPIFDGGVACDVTLNSGQKFKGCVWLSLVDAGYSPSDVDQSELWLSAPAKHLTDANVPSAWNQIVYDDARVLRFQLADAKYLPDSEARQLMGLVYRILRETPETLWPIIFRPLVPIRGFPATWKVEGWSRPDGAFMR
jgi:hypothetical protein